MVLSMDGGIRLPSLLERFMIMVRQLLSLGFMPTIAAIKVAAPLPLNVIVPTIFLGLTHMPLSGGWGHVLSSDMQLKRSTPLMPNVRTVRRPT